MSDFSCPLCNSDQFTLLESEADWLSRAQATSDERKLIGDIVSQDDGLSFDGIVRCDACALATVQTRPSPDAIGRFYSAYYASASYGIKRDKKIKRAAKRVRRLKGKIRSGGMRFLDVGANLGYACEGARQQGFTATGIEIDGEAVQRAQSDFPDNHYIQTTVEAFAQDREQFDLVYCSEVIEHTIDIRSFAEALMALVAPGGLLFLTTPADGHFSTPKPLVSWVQVKPPEHLHWLTKLHLLRLFGHSDFSATFQFNPKPGHKLVLRRIIAG